MSRHDATPTDRTTSVPHRAVRLASLVAFGVALIGVLPALAAGRLDALVPQPTTTTPRPTRPTTTVAGTVPRQSTTSDAPTATTAAPTTTAPPAQPSTTAPVAPTTTSVAPETTGGGPIPEPRTSTAAPVITAASEIAETSEPETAPFVMSSPVTVDPEDPTVQPPVIVAVSEYCFNDTPYVKVLVQNVDAYHYPAPFEAFYDWELSDGSSAIVGDSFQLAAWDTHVISLAFPIAGTYSFTVVDTDLGSSATTEVEVLDCALGPPPPDPLPPLVAVPSVACAEDFGSDNGSGAFTFTVQNQPGDDESNREYEFEVDFLDAQLLVDDGPLGSLANAQWAPHEVINLHSGQYMVTVTDLADPNLVAVVSVEVAECAPDVPPDEPVPPLHAPTIINVRTECADPVVLDGLAEVHVLNNNYQVLGGTGELTYDWTLSLGSVVLESTSGSYFGISGPHMFVETPLAPGTYTATIAVTGFPEMSDSATFEVYDCTGLQPDHGVIVIYGVTTLCFPGDDTEALLFVVDHYFQPLPIGWTIVDGADTVVPPVEVHLEGSFGNALSARHLPTGTYELIVTSEGDLAAPASTTIEISACEDPDPSQSTDPVDPMDPTDPSDSTDPTDPTDPAVPTGQDDPADPPTTTAAVNGGPTTNTGPAGSLPATGGAATMVAVVSLLCLASGALAVLAGRRR